MAGVHVVIITIKIIINISFIEQRVADHRHWFLAVVGLFGLGADEGVEFEGFQWGIC